jgi:HK97 family phage major capsid protein
MTMLTTGATSGAPLLRPEDVGDLLDTTVGGISVAMQVSRLVDTGSTSYRIPILTTDPTAGWFTEGAEITPTDAVTDEVDVVPPKVAGLTIISNELADDSSPAAVQMVGEGLSRDIARKIDKAFFSSVTSPAPAGLTSLTTGTVVDAATAFANLDDFAQAISNAEARGARITAFVTTATEALTLAKLKDETGSNRPLLGTDATQPGKRTILGVPLFIAPDVAAKTVWAIPQERVYVVRRTGTRVDVDRSAYFSSDRTGVRGVMRVGFGFPDPLSIQKITHA